MLAIIKICAVAVVGVIIVALIRNYKPEFTVEAVLCTSILLYFYARLTYGHDYFPIIIKVLAIAYVTEFVFSLCEDAGEKSIGTKVEMAGKIAIFFAAIPIFTSLINLLDSLI